MKLAATLGAFAMFCVAGCSTHMASTPGQHPAVLTATTQRSIAYNSLISFPKGYETSNEAWPLVVFLHGAGERGSDVQKVAAHGPPKQAKQGRDFPFVLVSPQCPADQWWDVETLKVLLQRILDEQGARIDRDRIYITGLSMGGGGTWDWISREGHPFAAAAIVCGAARNVPLRIKDPIPVWAFHGTNDDVVPPWITTLLIEQWKQSGGETRVSMYEGANHGSWDRAYDEPELWTWLLSHKKQPPTEGRAKWVMPRTPTTQPANPNP